MRFLLPVIMFFVTSEAMSQSARQLIINSVQNPVTIDGLIDRDEWVGSNIADSFSINYPVDNRSAGQQTMVRVLHDATTLFIAAYIYSPGKPVVQTLKRDEPFEESDAFAVLLDPGAQKSLGYLFGVNAGGAPSEAMVSAAQGVFVEPVDFSWDAKWFGAVARTVDGWSVEMAIPLRVLRFKNSSASWRINFIRIDRKLNERHVWAPVPVQFQPTDLGFTGVMQWKQLPVRRSANIALTPYALTSLSKDNEAGTTSKLKADIGGDMRISITPTLNADITVNPDFSQAEVDQQVTNLTRFSVFFPERRQFFLENADVLTNFNSYPDAPFFSRRIGLDRNGKTIPILYGARVSGNTGNLTRIGFLNMQTREDTSGYAINYTAAAVHRRVLKRSTIRGMFLNRSELNDGKFDRDTYSRNASGEFEYLSGDGRWNGKLSANYAFKKAITNNNHYYIGSFGYTGKNFQTFSEVQKMGDNYSADMGFLSRLYQYDPASNSEIPVGYTKLTNITDYNIYSSQKNIVRHWLGSENYLWWAKKGVLNEWYWRLRYFMFFRNTSELRFRFNNNYVKLFYPFQLTNSEPLPVGEYHFREFNIEYNTDRRKKISAQLFAVYGSFYNGTKFTARTEMRYRVQPWGNFIFGFEWNDIRLPEPYGKADFLLIYPKIQIDFSRQLYWTTFFQYNKQENNFNINSRLQWRYRPMSDIFLVITNNYQTENSFAQRNMYAVLKWNYYFQ